MRPACTCPVNAIRPAVASSGTKKQQRAAKAPPETHNVKPFAFGYQLLHHDHDMVPRVVVPRCGRLPNEHKPATPGLRGTSAGSSPIP